MTPEQIQQFKTMSQQDVVAKYTKLLIAKKITKDQYNGIIAQHRKLTQGLQKEDPIDVYLEAFGGKEIFTEATPPPIESGKTQKERLYNLLKDKNWHTTREINDLVYGDKKLTQSRIAARINDLKKEGHNIQGKWYDHKAKIYSYKLV